MGITPAGKGQNEFYFTFIEAQITIRNSFLVCKQGKLRSFGLHRFSLDSENRLPATLPDLQFELSCSFSMEMSVCIWRHISGCLWEGSSGKHGAEMATAGCSGFAESWFPAPGCADQSSMGGGKGANDPSMRQEGSVSCDETWRGLP